jgi:hypothetical protein
MSQPIRSDSAAIDRSEDRMFAVVARTFAGGGALRLRSRGVRVTHTLLFIAALTVSPGVCGACASGCPNGGKAALGSPGTGVAFFPDAGGCGACCGLTSGGAETGPGPERGMSCCGSPGCRCLLEPRSEPAAVPAAGLLVDVATAAALPVALLPLASLAAGSATAAGLPERPPERPVRVLYGVWRN